MVVVYTSSTPRREVCSCNTGTKPSHGVHSDVLYADDLAVVAENRSELQHMVNVLDSACTRWGMTISGRKTKVLAFGAQPCEQAPITLKGSVVCDKDIGSGLLCRSTIPLST